MTNGSGLSLNPEGNEAPSQVTGNWGATPNDGAGISCSVGGYVAGEQGEITGRAGQSTFSEGCVNSLVGAPSTPDGDDLSSLFNLSS